MVDPIAPIPYLRRRAHGDFLSASDKVEHTSSFHRELTRGFVVEQTSRAAHESENFNLRNLFVRIENCCGVTVEDQRDDDKFARSVAF